VSDRIASWLRTVVPGFWSALITLLLGWASTNFPWLLAVLDFLHLDLTSPAVAGFVVTAVLAGWYALFRWLEPRLPDWATVLVLGYSRPPTYLAADQSVVTTRTEG